jgi:hypothetical protein
MQRKRNEGSGLAGGELAVLQRNRTVHSENRTARSENRAAHNGTVPPTAKSITTFDAFRQNRDFHRML